MFISGLPEAVPSAGFKAALKAALEPFDASRIKLGCSEHGRLSGYAWATLPDAGAARRAREALDRPRGVFALHRPFDRRALEQ